MNVDADIITAKVQNLRPVRAAVDDSLSPRFLKVCHELAVIVIVTYY